MEPNDNVTQGTLSQLPDIQGSEATMTDMTNQPLLNLTTVLERMTPGQAIPVQLSSLLFIIDQTLYAFPCLLVPVLAVQVEHRQKKQADLSQNELPIVVSSTDAATAVKKNEKEQIQQPLTAFHRLPVSCAPTFDRTKATIAKLIPSSRQSPKVPRPTAALPKAAASTSKKSEKEQVQQPLIGFHRLPVCCAPTFKPCTKPAVVAAKRCVPSQTPIVALSTAAATTESPSVCKSVTPALRCSPVKKRRDYGLRKSRNDPHLQAVIDYIKANQKPRRKVIMKSWPNSVGARVLDA